jgi:hypothetical protein
MKDHRMVCPDKTHHAVSFILLAGSIVLLGGVLVWVMWW